MSPLYRSSIVYNKKIALRLNMFNAIRPLMTVTEPTLCLLSPQSTTSPLQPSPSSAWPSWSWAPCVWWGRVPVKAKAETTSSNLPACFTHSQVGLDFSLLFFFFPKEKNHPDTVTSPQVSAPSSRWRWCDSLSNAWSRARTPSGSNTTTPGPSPAPAPASSSSSSPASPSSSSPCPRCPGIHGSPAWTLSQTKWSEELRLRTDEKQD